MNNKLVECPAAQGIYDNHNQRYDECYDCCVVMFFVRYRSHPCFLEIVHYSDVGANTIQTLCEVFIASIYRIHVSEH